MTRNTGAAKKRLPKKPAGSRTQAAARKGAVARKGAAARKGVVARKVPAARQGAAARKRPARASGTAARPTNPLMAPLRGAERREVGHVLLDVGRAGAARVKRLIYPPGFRWSVDMKPMVGTELCMHAHVGFLAHGEIHIEYADGCVVEHQAPQIVAIDPGHDGWVVGKEPVVLIEFDFEGDTIERLGMPAAHGH